MNTEKTINILNKFLTIQNDRFENFEINRLETNEKDLKNLLYNYQEKCFACKTELINEIKSLEGNPISDSLTSKKFLHFWLDFKNVFIPTNREDLLQICEYNEYINIKKFHDILDNNIQFLTVKQIQLLNKQLTVIQKNHDYLKVLSEVLMKQNKSFSKNHNAKFYKFQKLKNFSLF